MKIVISGCGKIGLTVIQSFLNEGHEVTAIDTDPNVVKNIMNQYDANAICGSATDNNILVKAGVPSAELYAAITGSDEQNMLSCYIAKRMGAHHTIARVRNPEYNYNDNSLAFLKRELDLSMTVNPDRLIAEELFRVLQIPSAVNTEVFLRNNFEMIELKLKNDSPLDGVKLADLRQKYTSRFLICCVQRGNEVYIPDGSFVLQGGDKIGLTAKRGEIAKFLGMIGLSNKQAKNIMIVGGSRTAIYLARFLESVNTNVKIIEKDVSKCETLVDMLNDASIIHGDGVDHEILGEEGIDNMDAFLSLTGMDEQNILMSYTAQSQGVPKVITKVNRAEFEPLADTLNLESIVSPKKVISDIFVRYARALQNTIGSKIETLYKLMDNKIEAVEFKIDENFKYVNVPLKELKLNNNLLIAGILRNKQKVIIPDGDDMLLPNDRVVIISKERLSDLSEIILKK